MQRTELSWICIAIAIAVGWGCEPPASSEPGATEPAATSGSAPASDEPGAADETPPTKAPVAALPADAHDSPESAALAWCRYTQGPVPHWLLAEVFRPLSVPREREVLDELAAGVEEMVGDHLARERAVMRFLARNTTCEVTTEREDDATTRTVALFQRVPLIEEPSEKVVLPQGAAAQEEAWLEAFEAAWGGGFRDAPLSLRVELLDERWFVDARLGPTFAAPKAQDASIRATRDALRERRWNDAHTAWASGCGAAQRKDRRCDALEEQLDAVDAHREAVSTVVPAVRADGASVRGKVLGGGAAIPVLEASVENGSEAVLSDVWVEVRASAATTRCRLMSAAPPNDAVSMRVGAGESSTGFCRLDGFAGTVEEIEVVDVVSPTLGEDPAPERTIEMPEIMHRNDEYQFEHEGHAHPH